MLRRATARANAGTTCPARRIGPAAVVAAVAAAALGVACGGQAAPRAQTAAVTTTTIGSISRPLRAASPPRRARHHTYPGPVTAIGDSVMLDAEPVLRRRMPAIDIDASTDRAVETGITALEAKVAQGEWRGPIVFHLGNNSSFGPMQVAHVLQIAAGRRVVLVTDHCGYCSWVPANNMVIHASCRAADRCFVADWASLADAHPVWFGSDGVHMPIGGRGARAYTQLVVDALYAR
jgi:hypothetical protein